MQVFDEVNKCWIDKLESIKIVIDYIHGEIIYGYTKSTEGLVKMFIRLDDGDHIFYTNLDAYKSKLLFSKLHGMYFPPSCMSPYNARKEQYIKGCGEFPYIIEKHYEAIENFSIFKNKQSIKDNETHYLLSDYLKYTFGIEFETSQGYIPENLCFRDGLIPLRDGSINAPEYSTIILNGNKGISLLHQQIETLKEYTNFNKDCSLHMHFGNYPIDPNALFNLYLVCKNLQYELESILPKLTFYSSEYKDNGKNYCKKLPTYDNFEMMYEKLVGRNFFGNLYQAHPNDIEHKRKWNISTRYYFVNFINALCYNSNKTIEFRFLRPTYNFKKIILWIYIFNAILEYSEKYFSKKEEITLHTILCKCYPKKLRDELLIGIERIKYASINQQYNGDYIGAEVWIEDELFNDLNI